MSGLVGGERVTIIVPDWLISMGVAMWIISTTLKVIIWRLEKRLLEKKQ